MTKNSVRQLLSPESVHTALERHYKTTEFDPEQEFPLGTTPSELFANEVKERKDAKFSIALLENPGKSALGLGSIVAAGSFPLWLTMITTSSSSSSTTLLALNLLLSSLVSATTGLIASTPMIEFVNNRYEKFHKNRLSYSSETKNEAIRRWIKARYQVEITKESYDRMTTGEETLLETTTGELYKSCRKDNRFFLTFATPDEQAAYRVRVEMKQKALEAPTGEIPHTKQLLELEYIDA